MRWARLLIKMSDAARQDATVNRVINELGTCDMRNFKRLPRWEQDSVEVLADDARKAAIVRWYCAGGEAPFPDGTLIFYMELEANHG